MRNIRQFGKFLCVLGLGFVAGLAVVVPRDSGRGTPMESMSPVARLVSMSAEPESTPLDSSTCTDRKQTAIQLIAKRNIFSRYRGKDAKTLAALDIKSKEAMAKAQARDTLSVRLLGTVASEAGHSYAVLEDTIRKTQDIYYIGQTIGDIRIEKIEQNRVVIMRDGDLEVLDLRLSGQPEASRSTVAAHSFETVSEPDGWVRDKRDKLSKLETITAPSPGNWMVSSFLDTVRLSPSTVEGESVGLSVSGLNESTASLLGVKNGDVIQAVNDHPVTNRRKAAQILSKARRTDSIKLSLLRNQQTIPLFFQTNSQ